MSNITLLSILAKVRNINDESVYKSKNVCLLEIRIKFGLLQLRCFIVPCQSLGRFLMGHPV